MYEERFIPICVYGSLIPVCVSPNWVYKFVKGPVGWLETSTSRIPIEAPLPWVQKVSSASSILEDKSMAGLIIDAILRPAPPQVLDSK